MINCDVHERPTCRTFVDHGFNFLVVTLCIHGPVVVATRVEHVIVPAVEDLVCHLESLVAQAAFHIVCVCSTAIEQRVFTRETARLAATASVESREGGEHRRVILCLSEDPLRHRLSSLQTLFTVTILPVLERLEVASHSLFESDVSQNAEASQEQDVEEQKIAVDDKNHSSDAQRVHFTFATED